jgi:DNA (cytosine-5)-methyltransferase 1
MIQREAPRVVDLFAGAGGFSLGFQAAGCRIQAAVDHDEQAASTFLRNFSSLQPDAIPTVFSEGIEALRLSSLIDSGTPDIVIGGPPCQGFSRVGRAKLESLAEEGVVDDPRNELYQLYVDAIASWQPTAVVMENVPGMLSIGGRNVADEAASEIEALGYNVRYAILNAVWYGVPQFRERLILIGIRSDRRIVPTLPPATHYAETPSGYQRSHHENLSFEFVKRFESSVLKAQARLSATTTTEALSDLPPVPEPQRLRGDFRKEASYAGAPLNSFARLMRTWPGFVPSSSVDDHAQAVRRTPRDYETFRRMRPGDRYPEAHAIASARLGEELQRMGEAAPPPGTSEHRELARQFIPPYPVDIFPDKWRKLIPGQPSWTVPAHLSKDSYSHIHYDDKQARMISVREAARLQSFPDAFRFSGNLGDCFRQIGNAVPPLLSWAIAHSLLGQLGWTSSAPV